MKVTGVPASLSQIIEHFSHVGILKGPMMPEHRHYSFRLIPTINSNFDALGLSLIGTHSKTRRMPST